MLVQGDMTIDGEIWKQVGRSERPDRGDVQYRYRNPDRGVDVAFEARLDISQRDFIEYMKNIVREKLAE